MRLYNNITDCAECREDFCTCCNAGFICDECGSYFCFDCKGEEAGCEFCERICKTCHTKDPCPSMNEEG